MTKILDKKHDIFIKPFENVFQQDSDPKVHFKIHIKLVEPEPKDLEWSVF